MSSGQGLRTLLAESAFSPVQPLKYSIEKIPEICGQPDASSFQDKLGQVLNYVRTCSMILQKHKIGCGVILKFNHRRSIHHPIARHVATYGPLKSTWIGNSPRSKVGLVRLSTSVHSLRSAARGENAWQSLPIFNLKAPSRREFPTSNLAKTALRPLCLLGITVRSKMPAPPISSAVPSGPVNRDPHDWYRSPRRAVLAAEGGLGPD
jgi:hypothetical protein